jgi:hypothetical protein
MEKTNVVRTVVLTGVLSVAIPTMGGATTTQSPNDPEARLRATQQVIRDSNGGAVLVPKAKMLIADVFNKISNGSNP